MSDIQTIRNGIESLVDQLIPGPVPAWIGTLITVLLAIAVFIAAIVAFLTAAIRIKHSLPELQPAWFLTEEDKRRRKRRRNFARHLQSQLDELNNRESWQDFRFAELEAQVEIEGKRHTNPALAFLGRTREELRREKSLSEALRRSQERLIHLVGDPGAGKSVALRHLAEVLVTRARRSRRVDSLIPLY